MPKVEDYLFEIVQGLKQRGHNLDDTTLKELAKAVQHPQVMAQMQSGQLTSQTIIEQALMGIDTVKQRQLRPQGQLPQAPQLPLGGSALQGEVPHGIGPGMIQHPMGQGLSQPGGFGGVIGGPNRPIFPRPNGNPLRLT